MKMNAQSTSGSSTNVRNKRRLLDAYLAQVPFDGWTMAAYINALKSCGLTRGNADSLFPAQVRSLVAYFGDVIDDAMTARIATERGFARLRTREKVAFALRSRFEFLEPHKEAVRRLNYWYALPLHAPIALKRLAATSDKIWLAAGDDSKDFNYYSKRLLLAAVIKLTTLFWLDDESPDSRASWDFLDRRINNVLRLGKSLSLAREFSPSEIVDFIKRKIGG